jgi:ribosomal protein S18 acetylase RimI-like enzyme
VGFILFTAEPVFARGGYLRAIGVAPSLRGEGIGSKLMAFAEKAVSRQAQYFYLCVSSFNRMGQAFYKKRGYTRVGTLPGLTSPEASEYIYWKRLK